MDASAQLNSNGHNLHIIASRRTSALRCAPHRAATICLLQRSYSPRHASLRISVRRIAARRLAPQLNDLFVTTQRTPLLTAPLCIATTRSTGRRSATRLNSTICLLQGNSTQPNATRLASTRRGSLPLSSTICLSIYHRASTRLCATNRGATRVAATRSNSTQRFVCYNDDSPHLYAARRYTSLCSALHRCASLLNSTN